MLKNYINEIDILKFIVKNIVYEQVVKKGRNSE